MQFSFYGARLKVKRAYKHINELEICFRALVRENINATRVHEDSTPGHESDHVSIRRPKGFSEVVSPIVGDVVHNLRTALDFIAAEIVKNEPECIREISYFPLRGTKNDLISSSRYRFIQRAAPDLASVIADIVNLTRLGATGASTPSMSLTEWNPCLCRAGPTWDFLDLPHCEILGTRLTS